MASYNELAFDWNMLFQEYNQWTKSDLQLAAELGKTLLERNKELETTLKHHQNVIDDQAQEIEYLQKQTAALREVNDSRLRIYEQLEVGIQDLERANHRLIVENTADKKHIKSLVHNIETLESRCEELSKNLEDTKKSLTAERRKNERLQEEKNSQNEQHAVRLRHVQAQDGNSGSGLEVGYEPNNTAPENCSYAFLSPRGNSSKNANSTALSEGLDFLDVSQDANEENEELIRLMTDLETTKKSLVSEQHRVAELEDQLVAIIQENQTLQGRIAQTSTNEEMKSVHEELSILEEVRQGTMCSRCLRSVDDRNALEEGSSIAPTEDDDDRSLMDLVDSSADSTQVYRSAVTIKMSPKPNTLDLTTSSSPNPYRELVEKYEALLEVQRHSLARNRPSIPHEEVQTSGEYSSMNTNKESDENYSEQEKNANTTLTNNADTGSSYNGSQSNGITNSAQPRRKNCRRTPTEFSEAETSSSGFSDETSNKATQTDERQGYFLCSIGDGEDCKFSIYDDASPIDSRFRNRPEYRELFKEIFAVLKKAAENKEEGEKLPLLDDTHPAVSKVPPVTPANEELPDYGDDTQSIISSVVSEHSVAMSECITKTERKTAKKHIIEKGQENKPPLATAVAGPSATTPNGKQIIENGRVLTPLKREPLEYLSVGVGIKKKNRKKNRNNNFDRSDSPILPSPPRVYYSSGKKRRDVRPFPITPTSSGSKITPPEWSGNSMVIYNRAMQSPTPSPNTSLKGRDLDVSGVEFKPSTVSQDLHKLKKLDLSYAEVLRRADACKHHHRRK